MPDRPLHPLPSRLCIFAGVIFLIAGATAPPAIAKSQTNPQAPAPAVPGDFTGIVREMAPAVVGVGSKQVVHRPQSQSIPEGLPFGELFRQQPSEQVREALGSGFVIDGEGHVVTNNHVVGSATDIHVIFPDKTTEKATVVGRDPASDIAVLKINPRPGMKIVSWGDSDTMQPGAWTIAIGSPFGLGGTVTVGVLSARARDIQSGSYGEYLQTDASINRGNSGGPLFNAAGRVIGVNTAILSPVGANIGIGFAIPSNRAKAVVEQIIQKGRVERGYLGVTLQSITPAIAQALDLPAQNPGALVASVEPNGPAQQAGVRPGDVITAFSDQKVGGPRDLSRLVGTTKPGTQVSLTVQRRGNTQKLTLALGERNQPRESTTGRGAMPEQQSDRLGLRVSALPPQTRDRLGLNDRGLLVRQVQPNSRAAENGIKSGDIIVTARGKPVQRPSDLANAWNESRQQKKPLLLRIRRGQQYRYVAIAPS